MTSKGTGKNRAERRAAEARTRLGGRTLSPLADLRRDGKVLASPLANLGIQRLSWVDERLPEWLWAALVHREAGRDHALAHFRSVLEGLSGSSPGASDEFMDLRHSAIAGAPEARARAILDLVVGHEAARDALRPLLLIPELPAFDLWRAAIGGVADPERDWPRLQAAVAACLFHQSEEATDLRWLSTVTYMAQGRLKLPKTEEQLATEIWGYPHVGNMREVRATIRAMELSLDAASEADSSRWSAAFWDHCRTATPCHPASDRASVPVLGTTRELVARAYSCVVAHSTNTRVTTALDARHDTVFGSATYSLAILMELMVPGAAQAITGRLALRTILEAHINLAYLLTRNDDNVWVQFRRHGAGQAKLAFLKRFEVQQPAECIAEDTLEAIANDDGWMEFTDVDLGHWADTNLRSVADKAGVKDLYDTYYGWPSTYAHAQWSAVRDATYTYCTNPLHRVHRILRTEPRTLEDVISDAARLVDRTLDLVHQAYPDFEPRVAAPGSAG